MYVANHFHLGTENKSSSAPHHVNKFAHWHLLSSIIGAVLFEIGGEFFANTASKILAAATA